VELSFFLPANWLASRRRAFAIFRQRIKPGQRLTFSRSAYLQSGVHGKHSVVITTPHGISRYISRHFSGMAVSTTSALLVLVSLVTWHSHLAAAFSCSSLQRSIRVRNVGISIGTPVTNTRSAASLERYNGVMQPQPIDTQGSRQHSYRDQVLFSSAEGGQDPQKRKWRPPNPVVALQKAILRLAAAQAGFRAWFIALSRRAKLIVSLQLVMLGIVLGGLSRSLYMKSTGQLAMEKPMEVPYSTFMDLCEKNGKGHTPGENPAIMVENMVIGRERIGFRVTQDEEGHEKALKDKPLVQRNDVSVRPVKTRQAYAMKVSASPDLVDFLRDNQIPFKAASTKGSNAAATLARSAIFCIYLLFMLRMYRSMTGGGSGNDAPGKLASAQDEGPLVKFEDIEGIDSAKFEVMELVDTLRNPMKYAMLGARAPTGLLLEGPPGTGKTMLARATAATAGVPLLYCAGSDFVEMFVGRGAARVRKTFARAAKMAPCIVFVDELDALGKSRGMGGLGASIRSNDEAEQTLNQLLACMDSLDSSQRVCVLGATNRREVLDPALIRPGRFDRIVKVELPNTAGRERILRVHAKKLPGFTEGSGVDPKRPGSLGKGTSVDLSAVASVTVGLSGAELEFIVNEAAIRAVRRVSSKLREGADVSNVVPRVEAADFEDSVRNFYETRKNTNGGMGDLLSNVLRK